MKRYLNANEKTDTLRLITFYVNLNNMVEQWEKLGKDKEQVKYLKMARTYIDKLNKSIMQPLDAMEQKKVVDFAHKLQVVVVHNDQAKREYKDMMAMDSNVPINIDDLYDLVEMTSEYCRLLCKNEGSCRVRDILMSYDIPVVSLNTPEGKCPYKL